MDRSESNGDSTYLVHVSVDAGESNASIGSDVVCVIDVSGSMSSAAEIPDADANESTGLSILDLVKHAVKTVIQTLGEEDRLSLISFNNAAETVLPLTAMNAGGKQRAINALNTMQPSGGTNLWAGLVAGIDLMTNNSRNNQVLLLTDGMPNQSPPRGETTMLRNMKQRAQGGELPCTVSTFGFGYRLDSKMLNEISQIANGLYSFIPDSGFIGTTFVHAVANMKCRRTGNAQLMLESGRSSQIVHVVGHEATANGSTTTVQLPNLQFGQTIDVIAHVRCDGGDDERIVAALRIAGEGANSDTKSDNDNLHTAVVSLPLNSSATASTAVSDGDGDGDEFVAIESEDEQQALVRRAMAHKFRLLSIETIVGAIASVQPSTNKGNGNGGSSFSSHNRTKEVTREQFNGADMMEIFTALRSQIRDSAVENDCSALLEDLDGQVTEAVSRFDWFKKWGVHYLPSLARAHLFQQCNNFKDPGVQVYGGRQFEDERDAADEIFCRLPAPRPSRPAPRGAPPRAPVRMARFHNASGGCMHGSSLVDMADGTRKRCDEIKRGDTVLSPGAKTDGVADILCVVRHKIAEGHAPLVEIESGENKSLLITPWHPVRVNGSWKFPIEMAQEQTTSESGSSLFKATAREQEPCDEVFSFALSQESCGVCMSIEGVECISLAHGLRNDTVASHDFFGTEKVLDELSTRNGWEDGYVSLPTAALVRSEGTSGLVKAFR